MKVRMNENLATVSGQYTMNQEYEIEDAEADRLIQGGIATDPTGKVARKEKPVPAVPQRQHLDRVHSTPAERLPSSLGLPSHPPATHARLTTDTMEAGLANPVGAVSPGGIVATNAPSATETAAANAELAPLSENQPGDGRSARAIAGKK